MELILGGLAIVVAGWQFRRLMIFFKDRSTDPSWQWFHEGRVRASVVLPALGVALVAAGVWRLIR